MGICRQVLEAMKSRRHFLRSILTSTPLILGASALAQDAEPAAPEAEKPTKVPVDDPVAKALGYVEDVSKVDATKYPQYKEGQLCKNCALYTGDPDAEYGPCTIFQNRLVAADGWCASYAPKPDAAPAE